MNNNTDSVIKRMVQTMEGTRSNITIDNLFTSLPVIKYLLFKKQLTVVGALRQIKTCIPKEFLISRNKFVVIWFPKRLYNHIMCP